jgi:hypothetical protein
MFLFVPLDFPIFLTISFACLLDLTISCTIIFPEVDLLSQLHFNDSILGSVPMIVVEMGQPKWPFVLHIPKQTRGVSHCGLAIYIKSYVKAKEEEL